MNNISKLEKFLNFIKELDESLKFEIIEIGAHPYSQKEEPFYKILEFFPNSRINAFDIDKDECTKLNKISKKGVKFFPYAIGEKREKKPGLIDPPIKYQFSSINTEDILCLGVGISSFLTQSPFSKE